MRCIILGILSTLVLDSSQTCSNPQGENGDKVTEGCLQRICKAGVWRTSLANNICCFERTAYTINTTISSSISKDGCVRADIDCVEETPGIAKTLLSMENFCEKYATKEQMEEIKNILVNQIKRQETGCQRVIHGEEDEAEKKYEEEIEEKVEKEVVLYRQHDQILQLPSFSPLPNCTVPKPKDDREYTVTAVIDGQLTVCGGEHQGTYHDTCFTHVFSNGWVEGWPPNMRNKRSRASYSWTNKGLFVTGGFNKEDRYHSHTEYLTKSGLQWKWEEGPRLPEAMSGHCQVTVGSDVYILGGYNADGAHLDVWKLSEGKSVWSHVNYLKEKGSYHLCAVHDKYIYALGGMDMNLRSKRSGERMDLTTMTWEAAPLLPSRFSHGQIISFQSSLYLIDSITGLVVMLTPDDKWEVITTLGLYRDKTVYPAPLLTTDVLGC